MTAIVPSVTADPWSLPSAAPSWGCRDLDALETLRPGALTLVKVEAGAARALLRQLPRAAAAWDEAGLVAGARFDLPALPALVAKVEAPMLVVAGLTDAALREDHGRALLLEALDALREAAARLGAPVVLVERARRLSMAHPLQGVIEAAADEVVALRGAGRVELPMRGAQLRIAV